MLAGTQFRVLEHAVMPSAGVAILIPSPSICNGFSIGNTMAPASLPRTQCGTITEGVITFTRPAFFISCADHSTAWRLRNELGMKPIAGDDRITLNNATGHPHCPNDAATQGG